MSTGNRGRELVADRQGLRDSDGRRGVTAQETTSWCRQKDDRDGEEGGVNGRGEESEENEDHGDTNEMEKPKGAEETEEAEKAKITG
ncbi:hypothetical protein Pcac1_g19508 [Phytophthora cactorum]|nr:hypothetical protein Pcac1_g19508 [Phytophthora cactorum]KAG3051604.1 hypothetical protein PC122_g22889 [Phytophthora cactorum]KAG3134492.1 hypothetical protein PC128_g26204 [Phytophthora cactorum]KAG4040640.1 hypothetical protein PC123_g23826 [Phytophthora cactorum]